MRALDEVNPQRGLGCAQAVNLTPLMIALSGGGTGISFNVDLANTGADYKATCDVSAGTGNDVVYSFTTTQAQDIVVRSTASTDSDALIFLRTGNCTAGTQVACQDAETTGTETVALTNAPAGTYYLFLDTFDGAKPGTQAVSVSLTAPVVETNNDTCGTAIDITPAGGFGTRTVTAQTINTSNDYVSNCSADAEDVAYKFTLTAARDVSLVSTGASDRRPTLYVRLDCADSFTDVPNGCGSSSVGDPTARLNLVNLPAGTYFVVLDTGLNSTPGPLSLSITVSAPTQAPANDICTSATAVLTNGTNQTVTGNTLGANDNYGTDTCSPNSGKDLVYSFTTSQARMFTAELSFAADAGLGVASLHVWSAAGCQADAGMPLGANFKACSMPVTLNQPAKLVVSSLPAGSYLLVVDADTTGGLAGNFSLDLKLDAPAASSATSCGNPGMLTFSNGHAQVSGNTGTGASTFTAANCAVAETGTGADSVYAMTLPASGAVQGTFTARVQVTSQNLAELKPAVVVRSTCASGTGSELACATGNAGTNYGARAVLTGLQPTSTYYVWVDSAKADARSGPYTVDVLLGSAKTNESCSAPATLPLNASVSADTLAATNDASLSGSWYTGGSCALANEYDAGDLVYQFTTTTAGSYRVSVIPEMGFDASVAVLSSCAANACVAFGDPGSVGLEDSVTFAATAQTTYFVVVDAFAADQRGGFILSVSH